ncbi:MAG: DUF4421 family protein, partial [Flavihumibacter sp.]
VQPRGRHGDVEAEPAIGGDAVDYPGEPPEKWYQRPDIRLNLYGLSACRMSNGSRFSFRAPFLQTERQLRSSGTWLYGAQLQAAILKADSSLVPAKRGGDFPQDGVTGVKWLQGGPGGGYAYTLVFARRFFLTAAAVVNIDIGWAETKRTGSRESRLRLGLTLRSGAPSVTTATVGSFLFSMRPTGWGYATWAGMIR